MGSAMMLGIVVGAAGLLLLWVVSGASVAPKPPTAPHERARLEGELQQALASGRKIDAIKLYRVLHGTDLKDSKDAVERVLAGRA
jgi:ribosomal protein L7/L12